MCSEDELKLGEIKLDNPLFKERKDPGNFVCIAFAKPDSGEKVIPRDARSSPNPGYY